MWKTHQILPVFRVCFLSDFFPGEVISEIGLATVVLSNAHLFCDEKPHCVLSSLNCSFSGCDLVVGFEDVLSLCFAVKLKFCDVAVELVLCSFFAFVCVFYRFLANALLFG